MQEPRPVAALDPDFALASYDYALPRELIAQVPVEPRDSARLLVLDRTTGAITHRRVCDLSDLLTAGDLLVANESRVLPCRLIGRKEVGGGRVELLLLHPISAHAWQALVKGHRLRDGHRVILPEDIRVEIAFAADGSRIASFPGGTDVVALLRAHGRMPLPPYIRDYDGDPERYQTVYAAVEGSAAAPTAGLHFTPELLARLGDSGIDWTTLVLHVGLDTFLPVTAEDVRHHHIHTEWIDVPGSLVAQVERARSRSARVVAVGTTSVRALEYAAANGQVGTYTGPADLFITPGYRFHVVDALLTNFHLPRTSLLMLVSALAGRERIMHAYDEAIRLRYRFFSFGDAMLIL